MKYLVNSISTCKLCFIFENILYINMVLDLVCLGNRDTKLDFCVTDLQTRFLAIQSELCVLFCVDPNITFFGPTSQLVVIGKILYLVLLISFLFQL